MTTKKIELWKELLSTNKKIEFLDKKAKSKSIKITCEHEGIRVSHSINQSKKIEANNSILEINKIIIEFSNLMKKSILILNELTEDVNFLQN